MGRRTTGIGADGRSRAFAKGNEPTLGEHHVSHGLGQHATGHVKPGNVALDGAPKAVFSVPVHNSASPSQIAGSPRKGYARPTFPS